MIPVYYDETAVEADVMRYINKGAGVSGKTAQTAS